jgi:hypothetical protein
MTESLKSLYMSERRYFGPQRKRKSGSESSGKIWVHLAMAASGARPRATCRGTSVGACQY